MSKLYEKVFTREFTLPWLQVWYKGEAKTPKPWNNQINQSFPYIVFVYHDDTVTSYYDKEGLNWSRTAVLSEVKKDSGFIEKIRLNVISELGKIDVYLKKNKLNQKADLIKFLDLFQKAYPWLLAMWEIGESDEKQIKELEVASILNLKQSTVSLTDDIDNLIRDSMKTIFPQYGEYSHLLMIEEMNRDIQPDPGLIKQRAKGFIYTDETIYRPDELELVESKYKIKLDAAIAREEVTSIKGSPASKGYAKGRVRKIMARKHMLDFQQGEILVSPMTMPDFVPAMKKSAAIVTDEGGITCHAAIIARELNVPCIVGTKIATDVLRNGDLVEVDANNGNIRIINRAI